MPGERCRSRVKDTAHQPTNQPTNPPTHPFRQGWTINRPIRCTHLFIQTLVEVVDVEEVGPPVGLAAVEVVVALSFPVGAIGHVGQ